MGTYKVPQDVESDDKILGPLSMKQFIYAMIGIGYGLLTFAILKSVIIIWILVGVPPMLALLALGLYQKKDQSMETYIVSIIQFIVRPKVRYWQKEPIAEVFHLEPPPPKPAMEMRDSRKVRSQLAQLANVVDTRGWSVKHPELQELQELHDLPTVDLGGRVGGGQLGGPSTVGMEPPEVSDEDDMLSSTTTKAGELDALIANSVKSLRAEVMEGMAAGHVPGDAPALSSTSGMTVAPSGDILKLAAEGGDLSVAQIAAQAHRFNQPTAEGQQVSVQNANSQPA